MNHDNDFEIHITRRGNELKSVISADTSNLVFCVLLLARQLGTRGYSDKEMLGEMVVKVVELNAPQNG